MNAAAFHTIESLTARIERLELMLTTHEPLCKREWGLSPTEARICALLVQARGKIVPRDSFGHAIRQGYKPGTAGKSVDVHICRIRRKLKPFGIRIATIRDVGWQMGIERSAA